MKNLSLFFVLGLLSASPFLQAQAPVKKPFNWEAATVYFLLTDRFQNGNTANDHNYHRTKPTGKLRGFEGGDLRGVIQKIDEGYFDALGINAIWMTPVVEQIHDGVDEGTGFSYGFHGYWTRDWTALDPNFGTAADLKELVDKAHAHGIRVLLDAVVNHTGPVTPEDAVYPEAWVRTSPKCTYKSYDTFITCTLVENLPDVKTESDHSVQVPPFLADKWKEEGRYEAEMASLDQFFASTGYPQAPRYYIMKWLSDYITKYGIDGYRVDTAKHTSEYVWADFKKICDTKFAEYKKNNPTKVLDNNPFFTVGEVYGYNIGDKLAYNFGDRRVNYFANGFSALINFDFRNEAKLAYEPLFSKYSTILNNDLKGHTVMNYISSHDDSYPFDKKRDRAFESATKLLLAPGIAQVYYGDESARSLDIEGTQGDATLRSFMNWEAMHTDEFSKNVMKHWRKLGVFRKNHPSIGAGVHQKIADKNYVFSRKWTQGKYSDQVVVGLDLPLGSKTISVGKIFPNGTKVRDAYSGKTALVTNGKITLNTPETLLLIEKQ